MQFKKKKEEKKSSFWVPFIGLLNPELCRLLGVFYWALFTAVSRMDLTAHYPGTQELGSREATESVGSGKRTVLAWVTPMLRLGVPYPCKGHAYPSWGVTCVRPWEGKIAGFLASGWPGIVPDSRRWSLEFSCQWLWLVTQKAAEDAVRQASLGCKWM